MAHSASLDLIRPIRLTPVITRAFWSTERVWPGGTVRLHVETRFVPDATPVAIAVHSADPAVPTVIQELEATIEDARCSIEHLVDWDEDAVNEVLAATSVCGFCFVATIEKYGLRFTSSELYVPFEPFVL
jgi:hypothetical protein